MPNQQNIDGIIEQCPEITMGLAAFCSMSGFSKNMIVAMIQSPLFITKVSKAYDLLQQAKMERFNANG